jgi:oligopeptide/dipeptide ABC transporter ATP-binding protein
VRAIVNHWGQASLVAQARTATLECKYDPEQTGRLLESVGFAKNADGNWLLPSGEEWIVQLTIPGDWNKVMQRPGFAVADSWRAAGIQVNVRQIVEFGDARAILSAPQHPDTQLLLDSIPGIGRKWERERIALADIEAKEFQFVGCRFSNRCPIAQDRCVVERPPATQKADGRDVYCHFA